MAEKYALNWPTFSEHIQLMLKDLYQEGRYTDVTLVSNDQTQFKAHKIVLSACSPVFKKIIDSNPSQHPLIYLRGVQSFEVDSILQFMYLGEGRFYYERMGEFMQVAKDLEVKEISNGVEMPSCKESFIQESPIVGEDDEPKETSENERQISSDSRSSVCPECGKVFTTKYNLQKHIQSKHEGIKYPCNHCDYQATQQCSLKNHMQSKHEGIKYPCYECDYQATTQLNLNRHIQSQHEGIKYPCDQCDYQGTTQGNLNRHIQSSHKRTGEFTKNLKVNEIGEGPQMKREEIEEAEEIPESNLDTIEQEKIEISEEQRKEGKERKEKRTRNQGTRSGQCPDCEAVFYNKHTMMRHYKSVHEGIKYPCNECDYEATLRSNLKNHMEAMHGNNILTCYQCDYQTKWRGAFNAHKKSHTPSVDQAV